jgi:hypothetical protein
VVVNLKKMKKRDVKASRKHTAIAKPGKLSWLAILKEKALGGTHKDTLNFERQQH